MQVFESEPYPLSPTWQLEQFCAEWLPVKVNPVALWSKVWETWLTWTRRHPSLL